MKTPAATALVALLGITAAGAAGPVSNLVSTVAGVMPAAAASPGPPANPQPNATSNRVVWWAEGTQGASVAANGTFAGTSRASGCASGSPCPYAYFQVVYSVTQAGTVVINNGSQEVGLSVTANSAGSFKLPAFGGPFVGKFYNGATAGTVTLLDGFTAN